MWLMAKDPFAPGFGELLTECQTVHETKFLLVLVLGFLRLTKSSKLLASLVVARSISKSPYAWNKL